ncbi:hypothetical protein VTK73DRAFT_211 [Phialemonium thermophilum]|uniref:Zn(2)-C6 fungal-type domain-containing protein n=1 Tax=Phialemonium thermophilum TaxID=223376 RepID=A0ABR3VWB4_9PEZI
MRHARDAGVSGSTPTRSRRKGEVRTRRGCWKCRERRVKCPEQRPVCRHCERLGFVCAYDFRLSWQAVIVPDRHKPARRYHSVTVRHWMFLNSYHADFDESDADLPGSVFGGSTVAESSSSLMASSPDASCSLTLSPCLSSLNPSSPLLSPLEPSREMLCASSPAASLSPLTLAGDDAFLWDYFDKFITPQCALDDSTNPYRSIVLRVAASSPEGPLFQCILAASATQLHNLGYTGFEARMWQCRARALSLLRQAVSATRDETGGPAASYHVACNIMAPAVMLCFFEILGECSESWTVHANFAHSYLQRVTHEAPQIPAEHRELLQFSAAYFTSHCVLAATASAQSFTPTLTAQPESDGDAAIRTLTGCSESLLAIISEITELAREQDIFGQTADIRYRRNDIERRLHALQPPPARRRPRAARHPPLAGSSVAESDLEQVAETKRLTALLYLHARIDDAGPHEPRVARLAERILLLVRGISLRTNTILWPLFLVAVLGVRPEDDESRTLVLERLAALQATRQLGNVKKARGLVEEVWKARDLRPCEAAKGWSILADRYGALSLA